MSIVVDSSVAICWTLPDKLSDLADHALGLLLTERMLVPSLFWYEFYNILVVSERRNRIDKARSDKAIRLVSDLPIDVDALVDPDRILNLARKHSLTAYDAAYLELAVRTHSILATLDKRLAEAARAEGVPLVR